MQRRRGRTLVIFLVLMFALNLAATADGRKGFVTDRRADQGLRRGRPAQSLDNTVERIRNRADGRVLSADSIRRKGRDVHRIKILTDEGRVRNLYMDPQTGKQIRR